MKLNLTTIFNARYWTLLSAMLMLTVLAACGGGNGSAGTPIGGTGGGTSIGGGTSTGTGTGTGTGSTTSPPATGKVGSIGFVSSNPSGAAIVFKGTGGAGRTSTATLTFLVLDTTGNPLPNIQVTFTSTNANLATLSPTSATTAADGTVKTAVTAVGATGTPPALPAPGPVTVTATAPVSGSAVVTAISNQVIVATGIPAAKSLTIAPVVSNVEGWDFPVITNTTINVSVSDASGSPVVDVTAITAQTDEGTIGSANSSNPGCTTVNGICQLVFTATNPRYLIDPITGAYTHVGIATITVTANDGTNTPITGSVQITQSGSWPAIFVPTGATTWALAASSATPVAQQSNLPYGTRSLTCDGGFSMVLTDELGNPMAFGTTLTITAPASSGVTVGTVTSPIGNTPLTGLTDYTIPVAGSSIANIQYLNTYGLAGVAAYNPAINGTLIGVPLTIPGCNPSGTTPKTVTLTITTKSIKGDIYTFGFGYTYPT